jgi:hypothetical protein
MVFKSFSEFIREEYSCILRNTPIFVNPTKSEVIEASKAASSGNVRFFAVQDSKEVYIWSADSYVHVDGWEHLTKLKKIKTYKFRDYAKYFGGVATVSAGTMHYDNSDELDYYVRMYKLPKGKWDAERQARLRFLLLKRETSLSVISIRGKVCKGFHI